MMGYITAHFLEIIGVLLVILIPSIGFLYWRRRRHKKYYLLIWKKSSSIMLADVSPGRPENPYYYQRDTDGELYRALQAGEHTLISGRPLAGKTRAICEALRRAALPYDILALRCTDIDLEKFYIPTHLKFWRKKIVLIDDLQRFVEQRGFHHLLSAFINSGIPIIATCRSGIEYDKASEKLQREGNISIPSVFSRTVLLGEFPATLAEKVASEAKKDWKRVTFDGTIGSVFLPLKEMEERYRDCTAIEKTFLKAVAKLYYCGVYLEKQNFPIEWITRAVEKEGVSLQRYEQTDLLKRLEANEFIKVKDGSVWAEEAYLESIILPLPPDELPAIFQELIVTFPSEPDVLFRLGARAFQNGIFSLRKRHYMKHAIRAYESALKVSTLEEFPMQYGTTQNNLGTAYRTLAEVEEKSANCKHAIRAYESALKVSTLEE
ncbi:MAG: hypothetical protein EPO24_06985, partial [Bacteroidetes bacterium]